MFNLERADKNVMNLFGLITAIKSSAENLSRTSGGEQLDRHIESVIELCDIATEKTTAVWQEISEIETESDAEPVTVSESKTLAEMVASILSHPDIPDELFHAVISGLDEIAIIGRFKTLRKLESSPEYISKILNDYAEAQTK